MARKSREQLEQELKDRGDVELAMASSVAGNSGGGNEAFTKLAEQVLQRVQNEQREREEEELRIRQTMTQNAAVAAAQAENQLKRHQNGCTHRDGQGGTRVGGQILSGSSTSPARLYLECQACHKSWYLPRRKETDETFPRDLMPPSHVLGGQIMRSGLETVGDPDSVVPNAEPKFEMPVGA